MANTAITRDAEITAFGYRTALPKTFLYSMNRDNCLHQLLAKKAHVRIDNHQTFVIEKFDGSGSITILFTDNRIEVGLGVEERNW